MEKEELVRVLFDGARGSDKDGYPMHNPNLAVLGDKLAEGVKVIIVEVGEFEMEAILRRDSQRDGWLAFPIVETLRRLS